MGADTNSRSALLVVGSTHSEGHALIKRRLEELGYLVHQKKDSELAEEMAVETWVKGKSLVVISSLTGPSGVGERLRERRVPVLVADDDTLLMMGMVVGRDDEGTPAPGEGEAEAAARAARRLGYRHVDADGVRLEFDEPDHSLSARNSGTVHATELVGASASLHCARPSTGALVIASLKRRGGAARRDEDPDVVLFAYEGGAVMADRIAPARRVGFLVGGAEAEGLTARGWDLFDAAVRWAVGDELKQFEEVFREEWQEIRERRLRQRIDVEGSAPSAQRPPVNLTGLALSGGGIRSATFSLGLLQGMDNDRLLRLFDYVSTVSGGGYIGGWWSAWLAREGFDEHNEHRYPLFNVTEIRPGRTDDLVRKLLDRCELPSVCAEHGAHNFLSLYANSRAHDESRKKWESYNEDTEPPAELKKDVQENVIKELNKLVECECLVDCLLPFSRDVRFEGRRLDDYLKKITNPRVRREIEELHFEGPDGLRPCGRAAGYERALFNRMLLEDVFSDEIGPDYFPPDEKIEPKRSSLYARRGPGGAGGDAGGPEQAGERMEKKAESANDVMCAGDDPVHHLRLFANYLTPRKGLLSADTWRAVVVVVRNLIFTWLILVPILVAAVLAGQLYFVTQSMPAAAAEVSAPASADFFLRQVYYVAHSTTAADAGEAPPPAPIPPLRSRPENVHPFVYPFHAEIAEAEHEGDRLGADRLRRQHGAGMRERWMYFSYPLVALAGWMVLMASVWMFLNNTGRKLFGVLAAVASWLLIACWLAIYEPSLWTWIPKLVSLDANSWSLGLNRSEVASRLGVLLSWECLLLFFWAAAGAAMWKYAWRRPSEAAEGETEADAASRVRSRKEVQRNQTMRVTTWLLIAFVALALVLLLAGFGHELVESVFRDRPVWQERVAKWAAIATGIISLAGAMFTAVKASPAGGGDRNETERPSLPSRIIFAFTPPLLLVVLALCTAWVAHMLISYVAFDTQAFSALDSQASVALFEARRRPLSFGMLISCALCLCFAVAEMKWRAVSDVSWRNPSSRVLLGLCVVFAALAGLAFWLAGGRAVPLSGGHRLSVQHALAAAVLILSTAFTLIRLAVDENSAEAKSGERIFRFRWKKTPVAGRLTRRDLIKRGLVASAVLGAFASLYAWINSGEWLRESLARPRVAPLVALVGLTLCLCLVLMEIRRGAESHRRALWLLISANVALGVLLFVSFFPDFGMHPHLLLLHAAVGWLMVTLGWIVALGWLANPNALSMHLFYKSRLTRAYLGASNVKRRQEMKEVTEAVEGDDLCLATLKNCQRGGPYHLVNTTLNMAAGRDLSTAQRSSAMFVLSKRNCGSSRTGYRRTDRYMSGRMTLGTAVAVSGAAASPNMGSRTPSASLAMLMTLLNVRLGYWTPTPNKDLWQSAQAQLWPFYVLREFLSQTNDLASYCYVTDGGHFDNTGVYSLVERGCRYIVLADCGADPRPCFSDLGDVIRRCRIDFGAHIKLDIASYVDAPRKKADSFFIVGEIKYHREHMRKLGWTTERMDEYAEELRASGLGEKEVAEKLKGLRQGRIILFKPALTDQVSADVRQYGIENSFFPQQSTADQWFDESQFESYRQLGYLCGRNFGSSLGKVRDKVENERPLTAEDVDDVFEEVFEKFRPKEFESPRLERLKDIMTDEATRWNLDLTAGCRFYLEKLISDGAARIRAMDNFSQQADDAEKNLRQLMQKLGAQARRETQMPEGAAGGRVQLHERTFFAVTRSLTLFPFLEGDVKGHTKNGDPSSKGDPSKNGDASKSGS